MVQLKYQTHSFKLENPVTVYIIAGIGRLGANNNWQEQCTEITKKLDKAEIPFAYVVDAGATAEIIVNEEHSGLARKVINSK